MSVCVYKKLTLYIYIYIRLCYNSKCKQIVKRYKGLGMFTKMWDNYRSKRRAIYVLLMILFLPLTAFQINAFAMDDNYNETKLNVISKNGLNFSVSAISCSDNKDDGKIKIELISEMSDTDTYEYSSDGGRSFKKFTGSKLTLTGAKSKSYSVCVKKNNVVSDIYTVYVPRTSIKLPINIYAVSSREKIYSDGSITVYVANGEKGTEYEATINGGMTWHKFSKKGLRFSNLGSSNHCVMVRKADEPSCKSASLIISTKSNEIKGKGYIPVEQIYQNPELPTGCEIVSLTMLLNHLGFEAEKTDMSDNYLPKGGYRKSDPQNVFVGNPRLLASYGCFSEPIVNAAEAYFDKYDVDKKYKVINISGCEPKTLYRLIDTGNPVIVWGSIDMKRIIPDYRSWVDEETGRIISWAGNEHCLLLTGYDVEKNLVYFNDPIRGKKAYNMQTFELRYTQFDRNAVVII